MNKDMLEELTQYLDGEHPNAAAFEEKMLLDQELAQRCREYQALSFSLRNLPAPEIHPAFATRVAARLLDAPPLDWRAVVKAWQRAMMAPAFVVMLGLGLWWFQAQQEERSVPHPPLPVAKAAVDADSLVANAAKWQDDNAVISELESLLAQGVDGNTLVPYDGMAWYVASEEEWGNFFEHTVGNWEMDQGLYGDEKFFNDYDSLDLSAWDSRSFGG